ncbi:MAG: tRNA (adenosine(37)-N6)-threonylcarbamoyltransferase complex dimerization subunit type 1 TsaB [Rhodospirillaceae bacterium]
MRVLAFDTSMSACSVAVWQDNEVLSETTEMMVHGQAEALLPAIEHALKVSAITYADLDRVAVTVGPGSFTGVRVGLATARGLGAATGLPVMGIRTTEVIATQARQGTNKAIAVVIDARRAEVYLHCFHNNGQQIMGPACLLPEDAAAQLERDNWVIAGDAAKLVSSHMKQHHDIADVKSVNVLTLAAMVADRAVPEVGPRPVYIRPPDAVIPRNGGQLRP